MASGTKPCESVGIVGLKPIPTHTSTLQWYTDLTLPKKTRELAETLLVATTTLARARAFMLKHYPHAISNAQFCTVLTYTVLRKLGIPSNVNVGGMHVPAVFDLVKPKTEDGAADDGKTPCIPYMWVTTRPLHTLLVLSLPDTVYDTTSVTADLTSKNVVVTDISGEERALKAWYLFGNSFHTSGKSHEACELQLFVCDELSETLDCDDSTTDPYLIDVPSLPINKLFEIRKNPQHYVDSVCSDVHRTLIKDVVKSTLDIRGSVRLKLKL